MTISLEDIITLWFERQRIESHWFIGLLNLQLSVQSVVFMNSGCGELCITTVNTDCIETLPNETVLK